MDCVTAEDYLDNSHILKSVFLFMCLQGLSSNDHQRAKCKILEVDLISRTTIEIWFNRFVEENYDLEHKPIPKRPSPNINENILMILEEKLCATLRALSLTVHHPNTTVTDHVNRMGRARRVDQIVSHILTNF
ncbi:hypothetical protein B9Z55_010300 [Caenorhabditis nigoni]|uniref:Mos1 transposase HTH domain-containing protein n=1 Tax=Caenorhabditis nigoni TaxID=1611254 RepID=A0A2G5UG62_9PELO|nr:hypothetical protein B9Z55_010300 [Caenorhabditis nigoni]